MRREYTEIESMEKVGMKNGITRYLLLSKLSAQSFLSPKMSVLSLLLMEFQWNCWPDRSDRPSR